MIALMSYLIYWIYHRVPISQWIEKLSEQINESDISVFQTIQSIVERLVSKKKRLSKISVNRLVDQKNTDQIMEDSTVRFN